jgi:octaprenyl-diphosphate synthase
MDSTSTIQSANGRSIETKTTATVDHQEVTARLYGPVAQALGDVESLLHSELQSQVESLALLLRHGTQLGGKRIRPAILLLCGRATGKLTEEHVALAAVIEMIHTATLIHDDVLDQADTRRHVPTVNSLWTNHTSILFGDYLFAQSFRLAAANSSTTACELIGEAARLVCEGELRQILQRDVLSLDEETYFEIIQGKTAELCSVACQLGAICSKAEPQIVGAMKDFGNCLGIAFQIADDYLDLWGDDRKVGKTLGTDLEQGKMTLPLIRLLATAAERDRDEIVAILTSPKESRRAEISPWLARSDAREFTAATAQRFAQRAVECLNQLPASEAKTSLKAIAQFSVARTF